MYSFNNVTVFSVLVLQALFLGMNTVDAGHMAVCGDVNRCDEADHLADNNSLHEVRCCADVQLPNWVKRSGCSAWGESQFGSSNTCHHSKTFEEAETICASHGGRLCTQTELEARCTAGSGCMHDLDLIWSATDPNPAPVDDVFTTGSNPGTKGDPHFKTHGGEMYDFHGGCDMVLVDNPSYKNGLGLTIHIRTKIETWWSYVESVVIKIGDETLEMTGGSKDEWIWINGVVNGKLADGEWTESQFAGHKLRHKQKTARADRHEAHIPLGNGEKIMLKSYNTFLKVEFMNESEATLGTSLGLLGTYPAGNRVGRDGETLIEDVNAFGQEWQVTADEPKLFHSYSEAWVVPAGQECAMPMETSVKQALRKRRLASGIPMEQAEKACAHLTDASDHKACVFDVIATQDENMAGAW